MARIIDETEPLLQANGASDEHYTEPVSKDIVDFDPDGDPENPMDWPSTYKWGTVALLAFTAFTTTFTCIAVVPVANEIVLELDGKPNKSSSVLLVTIWELGEAAGPLLIAPLSEIFGRYPVIIGSNLLFIAATVLAALSPTSWILIAARFLTGLAVVSNVLNPAIVGDMFISEKRGKAMSLIMLAPLVGGATGPAISGAIAETSGWRAVMWMCAALASTSELIFLLMFRETYKVPILARKAKRLRAETGNTALRTPFDSDEARSPAKIWESIMRPAVVFWSSGVLQAIAVAHSFVFAYFYVMTTTLPEILENVYGLSPAKAGLCFIIFSLGSTVSVLICNSLLDRIYVKLRDASEDGVGRPELRLPLLIVGNITLPLVFMAYGWVPQARLPLAVELVTIGVFGVFLMLAFLPVLAFVVDAFGLYSASATTSLIITRSLMCTFLPLTTGPLVGKFGYGVAFTILSATTLCTAPIPILVMRYGHRWRQKSKYTKDQ